MIGKRGTKHSGSVGRPCRAILAAVVGATIGVGSSGAAFAVDPPQPERVWSGCVLDPSTVDAIQADVNDGIGASSDDDIEVALVFVYSLQDNDGQGPIQSGPLTGFTGPILCTNPLEVASPIKIKETDDVPASGTVNILDLEEAMILRYQLSGGSIEKRVCHTTGNNNDCFRIPQAP